MANLRDGSIGREQALAVRKLIEEDNLPITKAIEKVAEDLNKPVKTISSSYYRMYRHGDIGVFRRSRNDGNTGDTPLDPETERLMGAVQRAMEELDEHLRLRESGYRKALDSLRQVISE